MTEQTPILYSFRRCPYAMRARMSIIASRQSCLLREVVLRDKPSEMLDISPKATVPVLLLPDGQVVDESIDIMHWVLALNDPENWLSNTAESSVLISEFDGPFKHHLDRYKYGNRYKSDESLEHRQHGLQFLEQLNARLEHNAYLMSDAVNLADIAIFPFIRQFANTDRDWFDALNLGNLQNWLANHLASQLFLAIMQKYPQWKTGDENVRFVV